MRWAWLVSVALVWGSFAGLALAQSGGAIARVDARVEVAAAVYSAAATQAASERAMDAQLRAQREEIERLRARGEQSRAMLAEAQERFIADLAARDRAYAQEIAVFRAAVEDIAATPEGAAALARFNAGDELGALAVLDQLVDAREQARQTRVNVETAAERRRVATLALEARARGRLDTRAVITRYEEVTRLDPGVHWDWVELGRLYRDAGRLPDARRAAERAAQTAENNRDRSVSLDAVGEVLLAQGDLAGAQARYAESLAIRQALAAADPSSASLQRDVWTSMWRLQRFPESGVTWANIVEAMERMQSRGVLAPRDQQWLTRARANAASQSGQ